MTETKRDVFNDLVEELANAYIALDGEGLGDDLTNEDKQAYLKDYDIALPDDLPVIPEGVSDLLVTQKQYHLPLSNVLGLVHELSVVCQQPGNPSLNWVANHEYTFARAWVLGVWRVEETGEIVKLEEEK
ncbi:hypothetical protein [Lacticaseibacillus paracasei]|uniref:hypothetical protein n=1 Tax=Lacticaseibacillus paracasei TaxID=1597 RepID=UPI00235EB9CD|nr:hypothetical protein [Lacticaseibacillus paracasei]